ncbi:MAG: nodulation S family protein [Actinomycetota bacterium]|nr:nodulation S family protein [Actinomycetota bacterium]
MTTADFESRYQADPDPWGYASSDYERAKYAATLAACGPGPFAAALELGGSIGIFTAALAPRCQTLTTIDAAPSAVQLARRRLAGQDRVQVILGTIPADIPPASYDLVVASEILYYLPPPDLEATVATIVAVLAPGARLVTVHWRPAGAERPFTAEAVHARLRREPCLRPTREDHSADYLLDVLERR